MIRLRFYIRYGVDDDGIRTTVARNSAQAIDHAAMLLFLQQDHSKLNVVAAPDVGWNASSAVLLVVVAGCCALFFIVFVPPGFPLSIFFASLVQALFPFPFILQTVWCACLHIVVFFPRAHCASHCLAKSPCRIRFVYLCLVGCDHRARLYEASARTLVVLDVGGWKYQFYVKNAHTSMTHPRKYSEVGNFNRPSFSGT